MKMRRTTTALIAQVASVNGMSVVAAPVQDSILTSKNFSASPEPLQAGWFATLGDSAGVGSTNTAAVARNYLRKAKSNAFVYKVRMQIFWGQLDHAGLGSLFG
jgi:hypothetical protein